MDNTQGVYLDRMRSALGDKLRILDKILAPSVILDVGCADGTLSEAMCVAGHTVYGLDASDEMVTKARKQAPEATFSVCYAQNLDELYPPNSFDVVVMSSVLHEVFSYPDETAANPSERHAGSFQRVERTLTAAKTVLRPGGLLIIRDGVAPDHKHADAHMDVDDPTAVQQFMDHSPFVMSSETDISLDYYPDYLNPNSNVFYGTRLSLMEFAFTHTWGQESFPREVQELYGLYDTNEWVNTLQSIGYATVEAVPYIQNEYPEHLENKVTFYDMPFPWTNILITCLAAD